MPIGKENFVHLENGKFAPGQYSQENLKVLFQKLRGHPNRDRLVVHFHGGLVSKNDGLDIAERMKRDCYDPGGAYPVFFVWESHPLETVRNNLGDIFNEDIFKRLLKHVSQFAKAKLEEQAGVRGKRLQLPTDADTWNELDRVKQSQIPYDQTDPHQLPQGESLSAEQERQFEEQLDQDQRLSAEAQKIANALLPASVTVTRGARVQGSQTTLMSPEVLDDIRKEAAAPADRGIATTVRIVKGAVFVLAKVIRRFADRRDHGFFPTIVEELLREFYVANAGKLVWDAMKDDTADSFKSGASSYGGTAFLEELKDGWQNGHQPRIVLVGHSTGAIYICNWLKAAAEQGLPAEMKFDVVFLAPACTIDQFAETLRDHADRIANFRLFGMKDSVEQDDQMLGPLYPRSLLYFVSGALEGPADRPLVGMQRFYSGVAPFDSASDKNLKDVLDYLNRDPARLQVWSIQNAAPGVMSESTKHGDFDNDPATLASLTHILSQGF